mgnify:CR=1 FL=1
MVFCVSRNKATRNDFRGSPKEARHSSYCRSGSKKYSATGSAEAYKTENGHGEKPGEKDEKYERRGEEDIRNKLMAEFAKNVLYDIYRGVRTTSRFKGKAVREKGLVHLKERALELLNDEIKGHIRPSEEDKEKGSKSAINGARRMAEEGRLEELVEVIRATSNKESIRTFFSEKKYMHRMEEGENLDEQAESAGYRLHNVLPVYNFLVFIFPDLKDKILGAYHSRQGQTA